MKFFVLNGPNLNLLGTREPHIYGTTTIEELEKMCREVADDLGIELEFRQTNDEGELVEWIQEAGQEADGIVINPAAFTHYSIAVRDALQAAAKPLVEIHISNIFAREPERHVSVVSDLAKGVIVGLGVRGYLYAIRALKDAIDSSGG